jgi:hypothetical protein
MICYKDRTFCPFYKGCADGNNCSAALTDRIIENAIIWWGNDGAPIAQFAEKPECFKEKEG